MKHGTSLPHPQCLVLHSQCTSPSSIPLKMTIIKKGGGERGRAEHSPAQEVPGGHTGQQRSGLQRGSWLLHRKAQVTLTVRRGFLPRCRRCGLACGYKVCRSGDSRGYGLYRLGRTHIHTLAEVGAGVPAPVPQEGISRDLPSWLRHEQGPEPLATEAGRVP